MRPRGLLPCYSKMLLPGPRVRNSYLETLPITTWPSLLVITDCRTSCKLIRAPRSTGQAIEISHRKADPRGWSALKTISMLLNKTVEPVPEMAFPFGKIALYLRGNTSGNCIELNVAARAELSQIDRSMLAQYPPAGLNPTWHPNPVEAS